MLIIREMTEEDVQSVCEIEEATFSMPWKAADFIDMIRRDNLNYLVVELDGKIIGGAGFRNVLGDGEITNVAISESFRGKGYGRMLLEEILRVGKKMGASAFTLEVRVSNTPAISLYESVGFKSEGIRPGFYDFPKEDALIMWIRR